VINARMIKRDMNTRFKELRKRLENDANAVLDDFLEANRTTDARCNQRAAGPGGSETAR
jgi:hypothetical protein